MQQLRELGYPAPAPHVVVAHARVPCPRRELGCEAAGYRHLQQHVRAAGSASPQAAACSGTGAARGAHLVHTTMTMSLPRFQNHLLP